MTENKYPRNPFEAWLKETMGFTLGNPFATTIADLERPFLEEFFVEVPEYERIQSDETVLVFARRGGGKSALRVQLSEKPNDGVLPIELTDFSGIIRFYRQGELTEQEYGEWLLGETAVSLFKFCFEQESTPTLSPLAQVDLAYFWRQYAPHLLEAREVFRQLVGWGVELAYGDVITAVESQTAKKLITSGKPKVALLATILDAAITPSPKQPTVFQQFQNLLRLLETLNIQQLQFLVDRLDEIATLANNANAQGEVLQPLLEYLPLLEMEHISFKFFLDWELQDTLTKLNIRRDRLLDNAIQMQWSEEDLHEMLKNRLLYFSEGLTSLSQYVSGGRETADAIEQEILSNAQRMPRRMLQATHFLFESCFESENGRVLINQNDWENAREKLDTLAPPIITINLKEATVETTKKTANLTPTEQRILACLINAGGYCERETLIAEVWETSEGVSDENVDTAMSRLRRKKLQDSKQIYLQTMRGSGYKLGHYEVIR